jgi:hypothetical protein
VNTGSYVLLPTPASLAFATALNESASVMAPQRMTDQRTLVLWAQAQEHFATCNNLCRCLNASYEVRLAAWD